MALEENHRHNAVTTAPDAPASLPPAAAPGTGLRTWSLTIAISTTVLVAMYGLAYWNEARGDASRANAATSIGKTVD